MSRNLSNLYISESFQYLVQVSGSELETGLGATISGSLLITASLADNATSASYATIAASATSASYALTASYAENVDPVDTGSLLKTASISDAEITFTKGDASTFSIEVNNVTSSISASHAEFAVTASYATFASGAVDVNGVYTASAVDATITFEKGDTTTFDVTINNVTSSISSSYAATATSASYSEISGFAYSANSASVAISALLATSASQAVSSSYATTASFALNAGTTVDTGSLLTTASINDANITFTKGDGSTFDIVVNNVTSSISASYATTADTATSASYATSASQAQNAVTASYYGGTVTSASYAATSSYATDFEVAGTITALSASITYLTTVFETASVIYSSGSNQFGDASDDTQTLYGTVNVLTGPLNVSGSGVFHNGITGSLDGTATSASYAVSSSQAENAITANTATSATSASYALTASYVEGGGASSPIINGDGVDSLIQNIYSASVTTDGTGSVMIGGKGNTRTTGSSDSNGFVYIGGVTNILGAGFGVKGTALIGGESNSIGYGNRAVMIGGQSNYIEQENSVILGGNNNNVVANRSTIIAGNNNLVRSINSGIIGGERNQIYSYNRNYNFIGGGLYNNAYGTIASAIIAGQYNTLYDPAGDNGNLTNSIILGGSNNYLAGPAETSGIIASSGSLLSGSTGPITGSVIIGGKGITGSANNTVYVPNLNVSGSATGLVANTADTYATPKIEQVITLTQAEYDGLTPDDNILYVISGSTPFTTSGLATTGSNNFTGQITGDVSALTPSSNTASLDCSTGNFFTLTLGDGSDTRLEASNITAGQTINLQVTNGGGGTGTISFGTGILQPTGSLYTGSAAANAIDVVSMISFNGSNLLLNSVENFI
jgi:hypothetical protein